MPQPDAPTPAPAQPPGAMTARRGRGMRLTVAAVVATTVGVTAGLTQAGAAVAGVPTFPDNLVVFPDRDFITIQGYQDHIGQTGIVEITRPGVGIISSAAGVVAAGDVAFEITPSATYAWTQLATGTANPIGATDPDRVTLSGATTLSPSFTMPLYRYPMTNKGLTFRLTVTTAAGAKSDDVLVTPTVDQVTIGTAKWKTGDFRVTGTGSFVGATVIIHSGSLAGPVLGSFPVTAAAPPATVGDIDARLRNAAAPATRPTTISIESNQGGTAGPFTVS